MKSSHDPIITSWALNELSPAERSAFEEEIKKNPVLKTEAETTQEFCRFVQNHLRDESAALTDAQRARLKAAASGQVQSIRDQQAAMGGVVRPTQRPWWLRPSLILPLSAAAALILGFSPFMREKLSPPPASESMTPVLVTTATPKPEPVRSVLAPELARTAVSAGGAGSPHVAALHPVKLVSDVESKLKSAPREPIEIDVAQLRGEASGVARIVKTGAGTLEAGEKPVATLGHLVTYSSQTPVLKFTGQITGGGVVTKVAGGTWTLTGTNTYTGGTVISGGKLVAGKAESWGTDGFVGEPVNARGTVTIQSVPFVAVNGGARRPLSELSYLGDQRTDKTVTFGGATLSVNGGVVAGVAGSNETLAAEAKPNTSSTTTKADNSLAASGTTMTNKGSLTIGSGGLLETPLPSAPPAAVAPAPTVAVDRLSRAVPGKVPAPASPMFIARADDLSNVLPQAPRAKAATPMTPGDAAGITTLQKLREERLPQLRQTIEREVVTTRTTTAVPSGESYTPITENALTEVAAQPLSTFSIDVDTAAYANVRRFLNSGQRPPPDAVRIEEMINYFPYDYEFPQRGEAPFTVAAAVAEAPWNPTHRLARIAIKGRDVGMERRQSNFVFLVDVSGSMDEPNKLPLVQQSLGLLTDQITEDDRVAIVTYAGSSGLALPSTTGDKKDEIRRAIREMKAGGSTHGSAGIRQAYEEAQRSFIKEGVNRVILCTDGDFNVGIASTQELERFIKEKATSGVFLSVLGYGTGNTKDTIMETLADKGNGNYAYIDSLSEARKVLVEQMRGTLVTIAKDVKIQVEFNPTIVRAYRLIGYENRMLAKEDFNNDLKDAGEIGAGHTVTALYEIVPVGATTPDGRPVVDALKYQAAAAAAPSDAAKSGEMMTVKLRFKKPDGDKSDLIDFPVKDEGRLLKNSEREFKFATAVAGFGLLLRNSTYKGEMTWENVRQLAISAKGEDPSGYRGEFIQLIDKARGIMGDGQP